MNISGKREHLAYFFGDIIVFVFSLWLALSLRHFSLPEREFFLKHLAPFAFLFAAWVFVFFVAGLYEKQTAISKKKMPGRVAKAQAVNGIIGVFFFYLSPYFDITPKTNLLIYLLVSSILVILWRLAVMRFFRMGKKQSGIILSSGPEFKEIARELRENKKYNIKEAFLFNLEEAGLEEEIKKKVSRGASFIVVDFQNEKARMFIPRLYDLFFSGVVFIDIQRVYEDLFEKVPLSAVGEHWLLNNFYLRKRGYDFAKRVADIVISLPLAVLSLIFYPFVFLAVKIEDGGPLFVKQERIGQGRIKIRIAKFRSMKDSDGGIWLKEKDERITRVGKFLRKSRIDELPQLWSVVRGDISLIGPRPDIGGLRDKLAKEIPYYEVRDIVRPGLSGWAQIKQENPPQSVEETKERLMYDFYYIKNRSLIIDLKIVLRTIQIIASRTGA